MNKIVLLLLITHLASAGSLVEESEVNVSVKPYTNSVMVEITTEKNDIYDVNLKFIGEENITLQSDIFGNSSAWRDKIKKGFIGKMGWNIISNLQEEPLKETLTPDDFELSWDDKTKLVITRIIDGDGNQFRFMEGRTINVTTNAITINGTTEGREFCEKVARKTKNYPEYNNIASSYTEDEECNTLITVNGMEMKTNKGYASDDGSFSFKVPTTMLEYGRNNITIKAEDYAGNTEEKTVHIQYGPPLTKILLDHLWIVVGILLFLVLVIISWIIAHIIYGKRRQKIEARKTYEKKLDRRKKLRKEIARLEKKKIHMGLAKAEEKRKRLYEMELTQIQEELLKDKRHLQKLHKRTNKVIEQARNGVPSKKIRQQLIEEGYSEKEINLIKKLFQEKKQGK